MGKRISDVRIINLMDGISNILKNESLYEPVAAVCEKYSKRLESGDSEVSLIESFIGDMNSVNLLSTSSKYIAGAIAERDIHKRDIEMCSIMESLCKNSMPGIFDAATDKLVSYLSEKTKDSREAVRESLGVFSGTKGVNQLLEMLNYDEYDEKSGKYMFNVNVLDHEEKPVMYTKEETDRMIAEALEDERKTVEEKNVKIAPKVLESHIGLGGMIGRIVSKYPDNKDLCDFCNGYVNELNKGRKEEVLYESFISGLSNWNYLNAVDTELSAVNDRISKYKQDVDLKKILETMKETGSYYIVPLIEECVIDYVNDKNPVTKSILKQRLSAFEYDGFVRDIVNIVSRDQSLNNTVYLGESVEKSNPYVKSEAVYSPVKYISEGECVFNVNGTYFMRRGNDISKLTKRETRELSNDYRMLCEAFNSDMVSVDSGDTIVIYGKSDKAFVNESSIFVNGVEKTSTEIESICEKSSIGGLDKEFYDIVRIINENYGKIAYIDFVKHVSRKDSGRSVDVFRVNNGLFLNTVNESMGTSTFYRNVNPIQCRNFINEHMGLSVSYLFEDILPDQKNIEDSIKKTTKEYDDYIKELEDRLDSAENSRNDDNSSDIDKAIEMINSELEKVKSERSEYETKSDKYLKGGDSEFSDDDTANDVAGKEDADLGDIETPEEMSEPIDDDGELSNDDDSLDNLFGDAYASNSTEYDPTFDAIPDTENGEERTEGTFEVVKVSYNENVKTGKKTNKGEVYIMVPTINANGDIHNETKSVTFYISDGVPVINNDYMPLDMYYAIKDAIMKDPNTKNVENQKDESVPKRSIDDDNGMDTILKNDEDSDDSNFSGIPNVDDSNFEISIFGKSVGGNDSDTDSGASDMLDLDSIFGDDDESEDDAFTKELRNYENGEDGLVNPLTDDSDDDFEFDNDEDSDEDSYENSNKDSDENSNEDSDGDSDEDFDGRETPAETAEKTDSMYPIDLKVDKNDIRPFDDDEFGKEMDDADIMHSEDEACSNVVCVRIGNRAQAKRFKKYFTEEYGWNSVQFGNFYPELKKCFKNNPKGIDVMPLGEGVRVIGVKCINEGILGRNGSEVKISLNAPNDRFLVESVGGKYNPSNKRVNIFAKGRKEVKRLYEAVCRYSYEHMGNVDKNVFDFIYYLSKDFKKVYESYLPKFVKVPYDNFLKSKLSCSGIPVLVKGSYMDVCLCESVLIRGASIMKSFYGNKAPINAAKFINESLVVTIEDTKSGKKVVVNADEIDNEESGRGVDEQKVDTPVTDPFKDVTFNGKNMTTDPIHLGDVSEEEDEGSKGDDKKDSEKNENGENAESKKSDDESKKSDDGKSDSDDGSDDKKDVHKKGKKIVFKKKKKDETNESIRYESKAMKMINEAQVYDDVRFKDGRRGQVISTFPNGLIIVNVGGRTVECKPDDVMEIEPRKNSVEPPYKYDPATLKGIFEQMVPCGMYMNGIRMSPDNTYVKYSDYASSDENSDIRIVMNGENVNVTRKYIRLHEDVNDFANISDYALCNVYGREGVHPCNMSDYAKGGSVRTVLNEGESYKVVLLPSSYINVVK